MALLAPLASARRLVDACTPNNTTLCITLDVFASETGYYNFATYTGSSPDIAVTIGQTYTFQQSCVTRDGLYITGRVGRV